MNCPTGKVAFSTKQQARFVRHSHGATSYRVYRCGVCGEYHLTHKKVRHKRRWQKHDDE